MLNTRQQAQHITLTLGQALLRGLMVVWVAVTLVFVALRVVPGDAIRANLIQSGASEAQIAEQQAALCLNCPVLEQYGRYLYQLGQGDFGFSTRYRQSVTLVIGNRIAPTVALGMAALGCALVIGVGLGIGAVVAPWRLAQFCSGLIVLSQAIPLYLTAIIGIYIFSVWLDILPAVGSATPQHLILPALTLGGHIGGNIGRVLSASLRATLAQPFMLTARAKGLPPLDQLDHAIRIALLPVLSVLALQAGFLLGGTVIIEYLFVRRGLGALLLNAVIEKDYAIVQTLVLWGAIIYLLANAISSVGQRLLDPRLR